ncbi:MAG: hypothetical protein JXR71_01520 [Bacteroidales bacterium]|nr:hypothetical protein [Bacteroidales bacterium]
MKKTILFLLVMLTFTAVTRAQTYNEIRVTQTNGKVYKLQNAHLDLKTQTLNYTDAKGDYATTNLAAYTKVEYRNGSYLAEGIVGGVIGSVIVNVMMRKEGQEWWYGIGTTLLVGAVPAAIICGSIPRYKEIKLGKNTKMEVSPLALRLKF